MKKWLRRVRGALGMGLVWAIGGAGIGGLLELIDNLFPGALPFIARVDMWPQTLAIPGFLGGVIFAVLLGVARGRRRFEEFSLSQFAGLGAVAGLVLGVLAMALGAPALFVGITTLLSTIGGVGSLALARMAGARALVGTGGDAEEEGLTEGEARPLLGRRD